MWFVLRRSYEEVTAGKMIEVFLKLFFFFFF